NDIRLDRLLPARPTSAARAPSMGPIKVALVAAATPERFSRAPLDLAALDALDADLKLTANSVSHGGLGLASARLAATLKDRVLTLTELVGRSFDGGLELRGTLDATAVPRLEGRLAVEEANLADLLAQAAGVDTVSGTVSLSADLSATG